MSDVMNMAISNPPIVQTMEIPLHELITSQICPQIEAKIFTFAVVIMVLYMFSQMFENKIKRGKWFKGEQTKFSFPFPQFKKSFACVFPIDL